MPGDDLNLDSLKALAATVGLPLTDEDAAEVLKGVKHNREMASSLRLILEDEAEPVAVFSPQSRQVST